MPIRSVSHGLVDLAQPLAVLLVHEALRCREGLSCLPLKIKDGSSCAHVLPLQILGLAGGLVAVLVPSLLTLASLALL